MAKRKHHKKRTHRRKRAHMGAIGGTLGTLLTMGLGAIAGRLVQGKLESKVNPKLLAGGQVVAGMFLPKLVKGKIGAGIGSGMAVNGIVTLANQFGIVSAISGTDTELEYVGEYDGDDMGYADSSIAGDLDEGIMSGYADTSIAGMSEDYDGY
jgi:hypothetical protein